MGRVFAMSGTIVLLTAAFGSAAEPDMPWDMKMLSAVPAVYDAPNRSTPDVKAIFFEALPWKGKPTRAFAYYGIPKAGAAGKVPGMVLVHGGGGSAFLPWVKMWVDRGYAAIAMDTCGCVSGGGFQNHARHEHGGPGGWGGFDQIDEPVTDQWTYHAVADVILAHSLLRSFPEVDADQTGITGVSWGGYLTCIAAAVDQRFKFAVPVYGCGFLGDNSFWLPEFQKLGPERARKWLSLWDPSVYLPRARIPMLWVNGTTDFAYPMDSMQKSYRLPKSPRTLSVRVNMPHAQGPAETPAEIHAMAEAILRGGIGLAKVTGQGRTGLDAWVECAGPQPLVKAELNYTMDRGEWQKRRWATAPATLDVSSGRVSASLPSNTAVYFFNVTDKRGLVVSSEHEEIPLPDSRPDMPTGK